MESNKFNTIAELIYHNSAFLLAIVEERYEDAERLKADLDTFLDTLPSTPVLTDDDIYMSGH